MSIEIRNICKSFGAKEVLKGIDFTFEEGQVNMIIGASGSGKTVLVKTILGLIPPDEGSVFYNGEDFYAMSEKEVREIRKRIGMLFQSSALFDSMSVFDNVAFPLKMFSRMNARQIKDRVAYCLTRVDLPDAAPLRPGDLSGGMKKRVGIARAIALDPLYLICDEPNSGLDPKTGSLIDELIQEITREFNATTIVISHDIKSVLNIGDKVLYLFQGKKEWTGRGADALQTDNPNLLDFIKTSGLLQL